MSLEIDHLSLETDTDTPRVEIAQYVVEGTRSVALALAAIKQARTIDEVSPRVCGQELRVWLRGHYYANKGAT